MIRWQGISKHLAITGANSDPGTTGFRLDDEQLARVRDCLLKGDLTLPRAAFEPFVRDIEGSISLFRNIEPSSGFRKVHDALREIWFLVREDDPPVGVLRARIKALPKPAIEYLDRRSMRVITRLFPNDSAESGFLTWAEKADRDKLIQGLRVLSAEGAQIVEGRSRGSGKRSARRVEPIIFGEVRGTGTKSRKGGRPSEDPRHELVMRLALDWLHATGRVPEAGRSSETAFGDLVHSVFQWLLPEERAAEAASYALRRYGSEANQGAPDAWIATGYERARTP
jgi:hypothetical protein